ncbi:Ribosome maturation factor RimM [Rhodospirillaceae bacterium LM-1]|nr:Ribosome maturation factor RimM [Rhodospirillaceae bacterium LM-1]
MQGPRVLLGVVEGAHGVQGQVKVRSFAQDPAAIASYGPLECGDGRVFKARFKGMARGNVLLTLSGIADRDQAQALRGTELYVPRSALPQLDEEEEGFYHADLIGLEARLPDGSALGSVVRAVDFGAGDLLEIRLSDQKRTALVPFTKAVVPVVDVPQGFVVIDPPLGLLDEAKKADEDKEKTV